MSRSINRLITIGLGVLCSILLFVAGVLAVTTRDMSFGIDVNVSPNILTQVDMSIDGGSNFYTIFNNAQTEVPTSSAVNAYVTLTGNSISLDTANGSSPFYNINLTSGDSFIFKVINFTTSEYVDDATTYPNGPSLMATATATSIQGSIIKQYVYDQTTDPINGVQNIKPFTNGANASTAESKNLTLNFGVSQSALVRVNLDLTLKNYADKEITTQLENITSSNTYNFSRLTVDTYTTTLVPATNMALPAELEIYVGATLLTAGVDYVYNNSSGVLTINNTTATQTAGDISIKAKAKPQNVSVKYNLATGTTALLNTTTFTNGQTTTVKVSSTQDFSTTITAQGDKQIAYVVKVDGIALAKGVSFANGTLTVSNAVITGNLEITASGVEVWNGVMPNANLSYTFSGGSGTELDPYQIATATDLAYLSSNVSAGTDYSLGKYYKQTADIMLNNYFMNFDTASGLVLVKNAGGAIKCCIGTGINGTIYNTATAGTMGTIYAPSSATNSNLTTGTIPADLRAWTAIGINATGKYFKGNFDGNNFTVSGIYINNTNDYQGLFGYNYGATVQNVGVVKGYVKGAAVVGGIAGGSYSNGYVNNCFNTINVSGTGDNVGGIVGDNNTTSTVTNSYNTGLVSGTVHVGGVVGYNYTNSTVSNSFNTGSINGTGDGTGNQVGGVVGYNYTNSTVSNSFNTGSVNGTGNQVGGVVGYNDTTSTVTGSYNTGSVSGTGRVGGVVGQSATTSTVSNCYNNGTVSGTTLIGGIVGRNYSNSIIISGYNTGSVSGTGDNVGGVAGQSRAYSEITNTYSTGAVTGTTAVGSLIGNNLINCTISLSYYPAGTTSIGSQGGTISNLSSFDAGDQILNSQVIINSITYSANTTTLLTALNAYATANDCMQWSADAKNNNYPTLSINVEASTNFAGGDGTVSNPYQIETIEQLNQVKYFPDKSFVLLNDIDLNPGITFTFVADTGLVTVTDGTNTFYLGTGIKGEAGSNTTFDTTASVLGSYYNSNASTSATTTPTLTMPGYITHNNLTVNTWTPIGTSATFSFTGTFDGSDHEISGLFINKTGTTTTPVDSYQGLFGQATSATIKNIGTTNGYIKGYQNTGGIVGYASNNNLVENSYNENFIGGAESYTGGVVGYNVTTSTVTNSYNTGLVSGTGNAVGGVVGYNYTTSTVTGSYNTGTVSGTSYVGGIVGYNFTNCIVSNCYNNGTINAISYVGGVVGSNYNASTVGGLFITNSYNAGSVLGTNNVGGVIGDNNRGIIYNSYNYGTVVGALGVGCLMGRNINGALINNSYYLTGCATIGETSQLAVGVNNGTGSSDYAGTTGFTNTTAAKEMLLTNLNNWVSTNNANGDYSPWVADTEVVNSGYPLLAEEWGSVVDSAYAGGAGTSVDPYQIANADQLKYFANQVNIGTDYADTYFILTGHILINNTSNLANWATQAPTYSWTAIGNATHPFTGFFDGNGYTVSGIYINNTNNSQQGLFGCISNAEVMNVGVASGYIKAHSFVGGVVGITKNSSTVINCYNNATIYGNQSVGGLVGYISASTVANSYNTGSLTGTYNDFGGLVGTISNSSSILANCYNTGVVVNQSRLSNANMGEVLGNKVSGDVSSCFWKPSNIFKASTSATFNSSPFYTGSTIVGDLNAWIGENTTQYLYKGWYINEATGFPVHTEEVWDGSVGSAFAGGTGTQLDPYLIENGSQLAYLASVTNNGTDATVGKYYELTKSIMLNNYVQIFDEASGLVLVKNSKGIIVCCLGTGLVGTLYNTSTAGTMGTVYAASSATDSNLTTGTIPSDLHSWTAIGLNSTDKEFQGTFEGNEYTVNGIYLNSGGYQGLWGYNSGGTIQNVGVINGYVKGGSYVGGLVGYNYGGASVSNCFSTVIVNGTYATGGVIGQNNIDVSVNNCYNLGLVNGTGNHVGGLVGQNVDGSIITNSFNYGLVSSTSNNVGGLVGYNQTTSTVNDSYNTGTVSGANYVGGVVGYNYSSSTVSNSYNVGIINGSGVVGGVVGYNYTNSITSNSYNIGMVYGVSETGGIIGSNRSASTISNCYNTGVITGTSSNIAGIAGTNYASITINNYNTGMVSGTNYVGGIVGYNISSSTVSNGFNIGTISGNANYFGSIVGANSSTGTNIVSYCYNINGTTTIGTNNSTANNLSDFDSSDQILNSEITIGAITYAANTTSLLDVLNAWVAYNSGVPCANWYTIAGTNNDYPILTDEVWDGTVATAFAGGTGTEADPYLISNGSELAYLASVTNNGTDATLGKYYELTKPIMLNNYTQTFDESSGLVLVKDYTGTIVCCLGTGLVGTTYNTSTAGIMGTVYAASSATDSNLTTGTLPSDLKTWIPIGSSTTDKEFQGTFDGNGHTVSGIYINVSLSNRGLFGYNSQATVQNVGVINGFIKGYYSIGGVVGENYIGNIINCYNTNTIISNTGDKIGGIVGYNYSNSTISDCYNNGTIYCNHTGDSNTGGIVGYNYTSCTVKNCYNTGSVYGLRKVGGITGNASTSATITSCYNTGTITGTSYNIGGIAGQMHTNSVLSNCFNAGTVTGDYNIGGIIGNLLITSTLTNCFNFETITGTTSVGAIIGTNNEGCTASYFYFISGTSGVCSGGGTNSSYSTFDSGDQILNSAVTIGATTYTANTTSLLTILNAWVTANPTTNSVTNLSWQIIAGVNSGYPIFD